MGKHEPDLYLIAEQRQEAEQENKTMKQTNYYEPSKDPKHTHDEGCLDPNRGCLGTMSAEDEAFLRTRRDRKEPKYTSAPWHTTGEASKTHWVNDARNRPIANFNFVGDGNQRANAQLISASPELLEACKHTLNIIRGRITLKALCPDDGILNLVAEITEAIKKAEGTL